MKIIIDEKKVRKNRKIGSYFIWATFGLLIAGIGLSFNNEMNDTYLTYYFGALFLALIFSQVGMFITNRYGGNPRQDEIINAALKGIDDRHFLYHFNSGVSHLLIGPSGVNVIIPYSQKGIITYDDTKARWKQGGASTFSKIFGQNGLARPDLDAKDYISEATKSLTKKLGAELPVPVKAVLVFTNEKATVQAQNAPIPTLPVSKLKDYIRRKIKEENISAEIVNQLVAVLPPVE